MNILKKWFSKKEIMQPEPKEGQLWLMNDDIIDKHCNPIVLTINSVIDGIVHYTSNYGTVGQRSIASFRSDYIYQSC